MNSGILFFDKNKGKPICESNLVRVVGDSCPVCRERIETENEQVVFENHSRLWCWIKRTGQVIKKCQCGAWLKMPYRITKVA